MPSVLGELDVEGMLHHLLRTTPCYAMLATVDYNTFVFGHNHVIGHLARSARVSLYAYEWIT